MSILLKSARIIDPSSGFHLQRVNVLLNDEGIIEKIDLKEMSADRVIQSADLHVSVGWFDMRADFCDPGYEHKEDLVSGAEAAAAGGFTGVALLPNTCPCIQSKNEISYLQKNNSRQLVQIYPYGAITRDCKGEDLTEMLDMHHAGAVAFTDGKKPVWNTDILVKTLQYLQKFEGLLINKPEDKYLTAFGVMNESYNSTILGMKGMPKLAEEIMIARDLKLLEYAGGKIHFTNISSAESVRLIRRARKQGLNVTCDVAAYNLHFDDSRLLKYDTNYKVDPPLREEKDLRALDRGIREDVIDAITSSHIPQDEECKKLEFDLADYGMLGLQTLFPIIVARCSNDEEGLAKYIEKITHGPRNILGLTVPQIQVGARADLTLFDPSTTWTYSHELHKSKSHNSPLLGKSLKGKVIGVIREKYANINV
ncbi:MAG: dihydroorotase [Cyclobacteriaceae bacterium]|nr:dihydroorotase [Cyclobacteriaceae bacterium]